MEESFRNSLIIISALIIGAIFVHGLWTIRKNKNPYKLKANPKDLEAQELKQRDFDRSGFDQDGVSQVKVVNQNDETDNNAENTALTDGVNEKSSKSVNESLSEKIASDADIANVSVSVSVSEQTPPTTEPELNANKEPLSDELDFNLDINVVEQDDLALTAEISEVESVYKDPVNKPKPTRAINKAKTAIKKAKNTLKRDQMEINFGTAEDNIAQDNGQATIDPEVLAISVIVPQGQIISGAALLPSLLTLGMKYGDMNVFHRHQDNAGNGKVTFSLVNAVNPGTFDLDNMENFVTQGVSLFMTLPNAGDPFAVFDQMLVAAKQLALEFNGQLLDDKRSVLTKQTEQHYVTKIREFERKSRLASL